jgi:hypothetical protein
MVYAPVNLSAAASERFTGLTTIATSAGFVVAYSDHARNSIPVIKELSTIPHLIAKKWCIDESRIYLTGHSDGGTVALAIAILEETKHDLEGYWLQHRPTKKYFPIESTCYEKDPKRLLCEFLSHIQWLAANLPSRERNISPLRSHRVRLVLRRQILPNSSVVLRSR